MIQDKNRVFDGWLSLEGGVDAGREPDMLEANQCQSAKNLTFRGGTAATRPGFRKLEEKLSAADWPLQNQVWCFGERHQYTPTAASWIYGVNHTMSNPGTGHVRTNAATLLETTQMAVAQTADSGQDAGLFFRLLNKGYQLLIYDTPHTAIWSHFTLDSAPVDQGAWWLFRVTFVRGPTPPPPAIFNGDTLKLAFPQFGFPQDLYVEGEYKPVKRPFPNPDPPNETIAPWFENQNSAYIYKHGKMQCAHAYSPHNGEDCIMAMIGGRLFKIIPEVTTARVDEILIHENEVPNTITTRHHPRHMRNGSDLPIAYMCQADKWMVAQDGKCGAIIYDNAKARRAKLNTDRDHTEVPTGTIMAYGMGRLVVIVDGRDVAFGDLYGSHPKPDPADSLILFTERNFLTEGSDAAIPFTQGVATGVMFFPQLDTSTGNGQLMVFAERGSTSFFISIPREQWKSSAFQILSLLTTGLRGHRSISVVNEDLWFRSDDGVRSYRQARSEPSGWAHIPLSTNVRQYLENDSEFLLKHCSSMYFDNRIFFTTSPVWNDGRPWHFGMVVVDFDVISAFSGSPQNAVSKPAWEGQWLSTKFLPVQLLTGTFNGMTRAFVFGINSAGENQLYELSSDDKDDFDEEHINWELVSRTFDFQRLSKESTPFTENELYDGDMWLRDIIE